MSNIKRMYKYHYVYRITELETRMHYYGDRSCDCHPRDDIGVRYFSSYTKNYLFILDQKDNPNRYRYKIIKIFETKMGHSRKDATRLEMRLHKKFNVKTNPNFINKGSQSSENFSTAGTTHNRNKGFQNPMFGTKRPEHSEKMKCDKNPFYGKKHTNPEKCGINNINMVNCKDKTTGEQFRVTKDEFDNNPNLVGITFGNKMLSETIKKISESQKGKKKKPMERKNCQHCNKNLAKNQWYLHFDNCKLIKH